MEQDHLFNKEVAGFFDKHLREAHGRLDKDQLLSFLEFRDKWLAYFDFDGRRNVRRYLSDPPAVRKRRFDEFVQASRTWSLLVVHMPRRTPRSAPRSGKRGPGKPGRVRESVAKGVPPKVLEAYACLGLAPGAGVAVVRERYWLLARRHHPDRQGSLGIMQDLTTAYRAILSYLNDLEDRRVGRQTDDHL